jgi:hypothetical protein
MACKARDPGFRCRVSREQTVHALAIQWIDDKHMCRRRIAFGIFIDDTPGAETQSC